MENLSQSPESVAKYRAALKWLNGGRSSLPFTSADVPVVTSATCNVSCVWGTCFNGSCVCFDGYSGETCNQLIKKHLDCASNKTEFGTNLDGLADWSTEVTFVDLQRRARLWIVQKTVFSNKWADWDQKDVALRDDGYPAYLKLGQTVGTFLTRDLNGKFPGGDYVCLYDGDGILDFGFLDQTILRREPGRVEIRVSHKTEMNNGIYYNIIRTNPSDPIRNIRYMEKRFENTYKYFPYHPLFIERLKNYQTIRFMTWSRVNVDETVDWSNRTTQDFYTFTLKTGLLLFFNFISEKLFIRN